MKWLTWDYGRQKSGYSKMLLATSQWLKFDCYLLRFPVGTGIPPHTDPAVEGFEHHRINLFLNKPAVGTGIVSVDGPVKWIGNFFMYFRPDLYEHSMTPVDFIWQKNRYILSIGWLRRKACVKISTNS